MVPRYVSNIYGGNMTAPLWKDKIFASGGVFGSRFFKNGGTTSSGTKMESYSGWPCDPDFNLPEQ